MTDIPDFVIRTYKSTFGFEIKEPSAKMVVPLYVAPQHPRDCVYCGGIGTLIVFMAMDGPFQDVPTGSYDTINGKGTIAAKWLNDHWYGGKHIEKRCPACSGLGINNEYHAGPRGAHKLDISNVLKQTMPVEEPEDYTDI